MSLVKSFSVRARSCALLATFLLAACGPKDADIKVSADSAIAGTTGVTVEVAAGVATIAGEFADSATRTATEAKVQAVKGVKSVVNNATVTPPPPPVVISPDDALLALVATTIQSYPTLKASVLDGVITLTGEIGRAELPTVMQALSALQPKKIDNKATVKR